MNTTAKTEARIEARIEADDKVPAVHIWRDFTATPAQLVRAHTDPELVVKWLGPDSRTMEIDHWDARTGGSYRYLHHGEGDTQAFHGCFHEISQESGAERLVQTFTWEGMPEGVALETMTFEDLGEGRTRMHAFSLVDSFEGRDAMLSSGMEVGISQGYAKLDGLLAQGAL